MIKLFLLMLLGLLLLGGFVVHELVVVLGEGRVDARCGYSASGNGLRVLLLLLVHVVV